jgi:molybdenum cofactor cytidylyltransferase
VRPFISGLVLAAGTSSRLGQPKPLLPFGETTVLGRVLSQVRAAALDEIVVVLGAAAAEIRRQVDLSQVTVAENPDFAEGCASSYRTGLEALDPRAEAVAVHLADQPGVETGSIDAVLAAWRRRRSGIALASYRGRAGHPLILPRSLFASLADLRGDKAAWKIVDAHPEWVQAVPLDQPAPADLNTWEAYEAARVAARITP